METISCLACAALMYSIYVEKTISCKQKVIAERISGTCAEAPVLDAKAAALWKKESKENAAYFEKVQKELDAARQLTAEIK